MKYIPTDKLIAEIERQQRRLMVLSNTKQVDIIRDCALQNGVYDNILTIITSIQQEHPKFKIGDTIHKKGENTVFPMTIERISDVDYVCVTEHQQSFISIKFQDDYELVEQEQPEVDLEKEVEKFCLEYDARKEVWFNMTQRDQKILSTPTWSNFAANIARHFWNKGYNAKNEE